MQIRRRLNYRRNGNGSLNFEFNLTRFKVWFETMIGIGGGEGDLISLSLHLGFFGLYLWWADYEIVKRLKLPYDTHDIGISLFEDHFRLIWYQNRSSWSSNHHNEWSVLLNPLILGQPVHNHIEGNPVSVLIPLPENFYSATVRLNEDTWTQKRKFWNPVRRRTYVNVTISGEGIPMYGGRQVIQQNVSAATIREGVQAIKDHIELDRARYNRGDF